MSNRSDRFFSWIWRVNGVLLFVIALAGLVGGIALAIGIAMSEVRESPEDRLATVAGADLQTDDAYLGDFSTIAGTELLYAALAERSNSIGYSYSDGRGSAQNLLFFDTATRKAHWLLSGNDQTIPSYSFLMDPPACGYGCSNCGAKENRPATTVALLFEIRQSATDPPNGTESRSLAVASPDGRSIAKIAESTQGLLGHHQVSRDSVFVFYVSAGSARVLELDPVTRIVRSDALLSAEK